MTYDIEIADTVPGSALELRRTVRAERIGEDISAGLAELYAEVEATGLRPAGPPAVTYLKPPEPGRSIDVDLGVPVTPGAGRASPGAKVVGRHSRAAAKTIHQGAYAAIGAAYEALEGWILSHGYRMPVHPVVEALDPALLVHAAGLADLQAIADEVRDRLATTLRALTGAQHG